MKNDAAIEFVPVARHPSAYDRVIVGEQGKKSLDRKAIGELRLWQHSRRVVPPNLDAQGVSKTSRVGHSQIWDHFLFKSFGNEDNMQPHSGSNSATTVDRSEVRPMIGSALAGRTSSKYMDPLGAARVAAWTDAVPSEADPNEAAAPPVPDLPADSRRRRVTVDSDEEEEEEDLAINAPHPLSETAEQTDIPWSPNEVLSSSSPFGSTIPCTTEPSFCTSPEKTAPETRKRLVKEDSDDNLSESELGTDGSQKTAGATDRLDGPSHISPEAPSRNARGDGCAKTAPSHSSLSLRTQPLPDTTGNYRYQNLIDVSDVSDLVHTDNSEGAANVHHHWTANDGALPDMPLLTSFDQGTSTPIRERGSTSYPAPVGPPRPHESDSNVYGNMASDSDGTMYRDGQNPPGTAFSGGADVPVPNCPAHGPAPTALHGGRSSPCPSFRGPSGTRTPVQSRGTSSRPLIDVDTTPFSEPTQPPSSSALQATAVATRLLEPLNIIDEPLDINPERHQDSSSDLISLSTRTTFQLLNEDGAACVNTREDFVNMEDIGLDIFYLEQESLKNLTAMREAMRKKETAKQVNSDNQRKLAEDEISYRCMHQTMNQQAPNPGKSGKRAAKNEKKQERNERQEKAKHEAFGPLPVTKAAQTSQMAGGELSEMSSKKRQLLMENSTMASMNPEALEQITRKEQTEDLVARLIPLFDAVRAFSGVPCFEVKLGQVLVPLAPQIQERKIHEPNSWTVLFNPVTGPPKVTSSFTNILTTNGADVDRALEMKGPVGWPNKLWDKSSPGPSSVTYQFHCQSKTNEDFWIIIDEDGKWRLQKAVATVGSVNLHFPAQVWDASAVLFGQVNWTDPPKAISDGAATLADSLYVVPNRHKLCMIFRQPGNNEIKVQNLLVKRVSLHRCLQPDRDDFQLQVTEVKTLFNKVHPQDKRLWQGYEKDYDTMVREGRIHYEIALVHQRINAVLAQNESLELGELTDERFTGKSLLYPGRICDMLDLAVHMVNRMDYMGSHNIGTLRRMDEEQELRRPRLGQSSIPARTINPSASQIARNSCVVMGVRMNTIAEIFENADGSRHALGFGGSRVPVPNAPQNGPVPIQPEDSASQVGGSRTGQPPGLVRPSARRGGDKPDGFW